jgi:hypothetical protein
VRELSRTAPTIDKLSQMNPHQLTKSQMSSSNHDTALDFGIATGASSSCKADENRIAGNRGQVPANGGMRKTTANPYLANGQHFRAVHYQ